MKYGDFPKKEEGSDLQKKFLDNFFGFAGKKMSIAMTKLGLDKINDIRFALKVSGHFYGISRNLCRFKKIPM